MKGINKVILVGTVGKDPDVRYTANGNAVATFSLATNEQYKDKRTGEKVDKATWHQLIGFAKTAEIVEQYVRKGMNLYIEGSIDNQTYEKDGETKYVTKIIVRDMIMLNSIDGNNNEKKTHSKPTTQQQRTTHTNTTQNDMIPDDDLPF